MRTRVIPRRFNLRKRIDFRRFWWSLIPSACWAADAYCTYA